MPRMTQEEYQALTEMVKSCLDDRAARKAKIVLMAYQGWSSTMISGEVGVSAPTVDTVVSRYRRLGRAGLFGKRWVELSAKEREQLTQLSRSRQADARRRLYSKVVLDADQGIASKYLARQHKLSTSAVVSLLYRFKSRRLAALERGSYGGPEVDKARWAQIIEQWPRWVSLHAASNALGLSYQTLRGWVAVAQAPTKRGASPLISAEWFRELIRNGGTSVLQASPGLLLPAEIASRFGLPEAVVVHLLRRGLIRSKRIRGVFEYRLGWTRGAHPKDVTAYLAAHRITFDLRNNPLVSEREIQTITGMTHTPVRRWLALGKVPHYRLHWPANRQVRETSVVKKTVLEKFLKSRTAPINILPAGSATVRKRRPLSPPAGYLSLQEAARMAGVTAFTVRLWVHAGHVQGVRVTCPGKPEYVFRLYAHRASLLSYMARRTMAPPPGLVTLLEASRLAGVTLHVVKWWIKSKTLRSQLGVIHGRPIRFVNTSDVRMLLQARRSRKQPNPVHRNLDPIGFGTEVVRQAFRQKDGWRGRGRGGGRCHSG